MGGGGQRTTLTVASIYVHDHGIVGTINYVYIQQKQGLI